jgi:hypothetical protein
MLKFFKNKLKKEFLISFIFLVFCLGFLNISFVKAMRAEVDWPDLPGGVKIEDNMELVATLPQLINYFFRFAVAISGILAFAMLIYGGFLYLTSAGNPPAQKEARERITSAVLGILILLSSVLLLQVINPDVLTLKDLPF